MKLADGDYQQLSLEKRANSKSVGDLPSVDSETALATFDNVRRGSRIVTRRSMHHAVVIVAVIVVVFCLTHAKRQFRRRRPVVTRAQHGATGCRECINPMMRATRVDA